MGNQVSITVATESSKYPLIICTYSGTDIGRYWKDPFLKKVVLDATSHADETNDLFDYCNLIFSFINNSLRRRYDGKAVEVASLSVSNSENTTRVLSNK